MYFCGGKVYLKGSKKIKRKENLQDGLFELKQRLGIKLIRKLGDFLGIGWRKYIKKGFIGVRGR